MAVYACSDLHGIYELWQKIKNYLKPEDTLYFLGDAADRGNDGYAIISELLANKRVVYLRGNHEELIQDYFLDPDNRDTFVNWLRNGGKATMESFSNVSEDELAFILDRINNMSVMTTYTNQNGDTVYLSHSGFSPNVTDEEYYINHTNYFCRYTWDRNHFYDEGACGEHEYVVHGHTPVQILLNYSDEKWSADKTPKVFTYCDGHKIDIDMCSAVTGRAALLNLDTFEPVYFNTKVE